MRWLAMLLVLGSAAHASADEPARLVLRVPPRPPTMARHVVHAVTPAMRVWVLRGAGPSHAVVLAPLAITISGDADDAIDALQERAFALHADAVVHVRVEHGASGLLVVHGTAVRFA